MNETPDSLWLRIGGRLLGISILLGAIVVGAHVSRINYKYPRTDDAMVTANLVGIASDVSGSIIELNVADNQEVNQGDVLFVIDSRPYAATLARAQTDLLLAKSELFAMSNSIASAVSAVKARQAELELASTDVERYKPLLKEQAIDAITVDVAVANQRTAQAQLDEARQSLLRQQNLLGQFGSLNARIAAAEASVRAAQLNVDYCRVRCPFKARVANLHISVGQFAQTGVPLFALVDTRRWYVVANFQETYVESIHPGQEVDLYLMAYPRRRFQGKVEGVGWAIRSQNDAVSGVLPDVKQTLNWVRLAQRIPVRIQLQDPDPHQPYRMGMTAVVTMHKNSGAAVQTRSLPKP